MNAVAAERAALLRYLLGHPRPADPKTTALMIVREMTALILPPAPPRRWVDTPKGIQHSIFVMESQE